jgi:hypothetical protein
MARRRKSTRRQLSAKRRAAAMAELQRYTKKPVPPGTAAATYLNGLMQRYRKLGDLSGLPRRVRRDMERRVLTRLQEAMEQLQFRPAQFGATSLAAVARIFVQSLARFGVHRYTAKELKLVRSNLFGRLFHDYALNEPVLVRLWRELARQALKELNSLAAKGSPRLVIAVKKKHPPTFKGTFGPIREASEIWAVTKNGRKEFIDGALVTLLDDDPASRVGSLLVALEFKGLGAAKSGFREQIGEQLSRLADLKHIEMRVKGFNKPVILPRDGVVLMLGGGNRLAIQPSIGKGTHYDIQTTKTGGHHEWFHLISTRIRSDTLYRLIDLVIR